MFVNSSYAGKLSIEDLKPTYLTIVLTVFSVFLMAEAGSNPGSPVQLPGLVQNQMLGPFYETCYNCQPSLDGVLTSLIVSFGISTGITTSLKTFNVSPDEFAVETLFPGQKPAIKMLGVASLLALIFGAIGIPLYYIRPQTVTCAALSCPEPSPAEIKIQNLVLNIIFWYVITGLIRKTKRIRQDSSA